MINHDQHYDANGDLHDAPGDIEAQPIGAMLPTLNLEMMHRAAMFRTFRLCRGRTHAMQRMLGCSLRKIQYWKLTESAHLEQIERQWRAAAMADRVTAKEGA